MSNPIEALPLETVQQIDELCDRFEEGWSADHQFQIEQFLREVSPEVQPALLTALLPIELELLETEGRQPDIESYRSRFPQFAEAIAAVVAATDQEGKSKTYQTGAAETFVSNPGTDEPQPDQAEASTPTLMRGNIDSQTSIKPVAAGQESASIIEGDFGRYQIKKTLGQGAMGAVYLAHDTQLDRQVALKIPKFTDDPNGEMLERFYREARSAAMLRSPNICPVFDVGEIDGQHYITMAFIAGRTLKDFTKSKKRHSEKQIAVTIRKLAVGLGEAHAHGVIHRDLKPANIMIDGKGEPVVMDFGLARRNASSEVEVTQTGAILGTPAYMSPEQVDGEQSEIGPQSDIYSLGVIMYELVTGQMPFQGTLMKILKQIAVDEPQPPSELRDDLDPTIETICLKMMAKDLSARYQSMEEVARDLAAYLKKPRKKKTVDTAKPVVDASTSEPVVEGEESNPVLKTAPPKAKQLAKPAAVKKPGKSSKPPQTKSLGKFDIARNRKIAIAVAAIAACGLLYGAITLFLRVGEVDVKVVIDDPSISVHFEEGDVVRFEGSGKPIRLSPGKQKFVIERDGLQAKAAEFTVSKDGKTVLHVAIINGKLAVVGDGVKPQKIARQVASKNSDRDIATWVITAGGRVTMNAGETEELQPKSHVSWIDSLEELPTGSIRLEGLYIPVVDQETIGRLPELAQVKRLKALTLDLLEWKGKSIDTELAEIKELKSLEYLHVATTPRYPGSGRRGPRLNGACLKTVAQLPALTVLHLQFLAVTDSDLEFIKDVRSLRTVHLSQAEISDAALAHLSKLQQLELLSLYGTRIGDQGLKFVGELSSLQMLQLSKTQVTDKGLSSLHSLKNLHELWLGQTKVTSAGVAALKAALPNCEVLGMAGANSPPRAIAPFDTAQAKAHQQAWADYLGLPVEKDVQLPGGATMKFMLIPPGEFKMGSSEDEQAQFLKEAEAAQDKFAIDRIPDEGPQHLVRITQPFWLSQNEVTIDQFRAFVKDNGYKTDAERDGKGGFGLVDGKTVQAPQFVWNAEPGFPQTGEYPVANVSWNDATSFCEWLTSKRRGGQASLPTEAQWEYACRAGTTTRWNSGDRAANILLAGWVFENSERRSHPVGQLQPNGFGLRDMHGNVWEWCRDFYDGEYYAVSPKNDPPGPARSAVQVIRGGGWSHYSRLSRAAHRMRHPRSHRMHYIGFRVAMTIDVSKRKTVANSPKPSNDYDSIATGKWIDVFRDHLPKNDNHGEKLKFKDGVLELEKATVTFPEINGRNMIIRASVKNLKPEEWECLSLRGQFGKGSYSAGISSSKGTSITGWIDKKIHDLKTLRSDRTAIATDREGFFQMAFVAIDDRLSLYLNGTKLLEATDASLASGNPGMGFVNGHGLFKDVEVMLLDSAQRKTIRTPPAASISPFDEAQAKAHQKAWADYLGEPVETTNSVGMKLAIIPPGKFTMGSPASEPGHTSTEEQVEVVLTKPFRLGVHEVTQGQWKAVMGTEPWKGHKYDGPPGANVAATWMSWTEATQFCRKLTEQERASGRLSGDEHFRLPTEAEWEYACRAGTTTTYSFGDDASVLGEYAWYKENATIAGRESAVYEVGLKKPNSWGLYDVHGNVREWCSDWHGPKLPGGTDPRGALEGTLRVHRGGGSFIKARLSRSAFRDMRIPSFVYYGLGFRVVLTIDSVN